MKPNIHEELVVHIRDNQTGKINQSRPYIRHCSQDKGIYYERDGQFFHEDWTPRTDIAQPVVDQKKTEILPASVVTSKKSKEDNVG